MRTGDESDDEVQYQNEIDDEADEAIERLNRAPPILSAIAQRCLAASLPGLRRMIFGDG